MNFSSLIIFLLICLTGVISTRGKKYALLVAATKSWLNYRHQSTVLHFYQTLVANGFPKNNIITMVYDDIAYHPKNKEPGVIRNHPRGKNVNEDVRKDYTGAKINGDVLLAVLNGNASIAQGPVFHNTTSKDNLIIYFVGYTYGDSMMLFPDLSSLSAKTLANTLVDLTTKEKFGKIYVNLETSFGEMIFADKIPFDSKIIVSAVTSNIEFPYAIYCDTKDKLCYGSLYGVTWTEYSDRLRQLRSGRYKDLFDVYNHVRYRIPFSHVSLSGDLSLGTTKLRDFIGYKYEGKQTTDEKVGFAETEADFTEDIPNFEAYSDAEMVVHKARNHIHKDRIDNMSKNFIVRVEEAEKKNQRLSFEQNLNFHEESFYM